MIDSPLGQLIGALGAVVVLDVAGAALRDRGDRLERRGALELGEDRARTGGRGCGRAR